MVGVIYGTSRLLFQSLLGRLKTGKIVVHAEYVTKVSIPLR